MEVFRMKAADGRGLELQRFEDVIQPNIDGADPAKGTKFSKEFKYKQGDILMCTYPKCGSHWLINMMWKLIGTERSKRGMDTALELYQTEIYETMPSPRVMMTHYKPSRLPTEHLQNKGKIVLMIRNPKDAMVSMYHHWKDAVFFQNSQTWDEFFQSYIAGLTPCGSYFDYVQQWEQFLRDKPTDHHVEVFFYEDFKSNLSYNIGRLSHFLGFKRDQTFIEDVMKETTLSALKEQDGSGKRDTIEMVRDEKGDSVIYRKGEVGGWKNYLTVAQSETVDKLMKERLQYGILNVNYNIGRLNHFLGFKRDQTYIDKVMKETSLSALNEQDGSRKRDTIEMVRGEKGDSVIYRKGEVGGWKNYLTVAQSEFVDKLMEERLKYGILNVKFQTRQTYIENVMKETTLSALKEQDGSGKRDTIEMVRDENGDSVIYRKGEVGGWKNFLTVAQSETVDKLMKERLKYGIFNVKYEL